MMEQSLVITLLARPLLSEDHEGGEYWSRACVRPVGPLTVLSRPDARAWVWTGGLDQLISYSWPWYGANAAKTSNRLSPARTHRQDYRTVRVRVGQGLQFVPNKSFQLAVPYH